MESKKINIEKLNVNEKLDEMENLNAIFDSSPVPMFVLDETTDIIRINKAALSLTNGSADDFLRHRPGNALRCVHSSNDPRGCGFAPECPTCPVRNAIESLIAEGGSLQGAELELELVQPEGPKKVWVRIGAESVLIDGRTHLCVAMEVITERKQIEIQLQESENRYKKAEALGHVGNWEYNLETTLFWASDQARQIYGLDRDLENISIENVLNCIPDREIEYQALIDLIENNKEYNRVIEIIAQNTAERRTIRTIADLQRNSTGQPLKVSGVLIDITEIDKAKKALVDNEEKFRSIFEHSPIGKSITKIDGELEVNKSFCDILGYSEQEMKTKYFQELTHPDDILKSTDAMQDLLDEKKDRVQFEKRYLHKNGSTVWADITIALKRDVNNKPEYFITSIQDITERHIYEQELKLYRDNLEDLVKKRTAELEEKNEKLERFNKLFVDREFRIKELKDRVKELEG